MCYYQYRGYVGAHLREFQMANVMIITGTALFFVSMNLIIQGAIRSIPGLMYAGVALCIIMFLIAVIGFIKMYQVRKKIEQEIRNNPPQNILVSGCHPVTYPMGAVQAPPAAGAAYQPPPAPPGYPQNPTGFTQSTTQGFTPTSQLPQYGDLTSQQFAAPVTSTHQQQFGSNMEYGPGTADQPPAYTSIVNSNYNTEYGAKY